MASERIENRVESSLLISSGLFRSLIAGLAILLALAAAFYGLTNWRGRRAWDQFRQQWTAAGGKLDMDEIVPPAVPDGQNFASTPLLKSLLDYRPGEGLSGESSWAQKNARVLAVGLNKPRPNGSMGHPDIGDWRRGLKTDLGPWRSHLAEAAPTAKTASNQTAPSAAMVFQPGPPGVAGEVLSGLSAFDPDIVELRGAAAARPLARFPIHYDEKAAALLTHLGPLQSIAEVLELRAIAELEVAQSDVALADMALILRLAEAVRTEPLPVSQRDRADIALHSLQPLWEGVAAHRWSEGQLQKFETELSGIDMVRSYAEALKADIAFVNSLLLSRQPVMAEEPNPLSPTQQALYQRWAPQGWFYQDSAFACSFVRDRVLGAIDADRERINARMAESAVTWLKDAGAGCSYRRRALVYPALKFLPPVAHAHASIQLARVGCALERYRLGLGNYPEQLAALVPKFMSAVPHDVMTGDALKYRREGNDQYTLYSVGWNQTDDGGALPQVPPAVAKNSDDWLQTGDWVWKIGL